MPVCFSELISISDRNRYFVVRIVIIQIVMICIYLFWNINVLLIVLMYVVQLLYINYINSDVSRISCSSVEDIGIFEILNSYLYIKIWDDK